MSLLIDIIVIAIIGLCIFLGYKRGLIGVAVKLFSFIIAIAISLILFKPVSNYIVNNTVIDEKIENSVIEIIKGQDIDANEIQKEKNENTPQIIKEYINSSIERASQDLKDNIAKTVSRKVTENIINIGTMIVIFIIAKILLIFLKIFSDTISELPIVKQFNKLGGTIYGILQGLFIIYLAFLIISLFLPIIPLLEAINNSYIGSILYNNNLLLMILF